MRISDWSSDVCSSDLGGGGCDGAGCMDFRKLNGVVLHVQDLGAADKPALVFSNALGTDFRIWNEVVGQFADRFRIVLYAKRGHGLSAIDTPPYTIADHVADLAALLAALALEGALVCGLSVGGLIAQGLYASRPELVSGLVPCDTAPARTHAGSGKRG